VSKKNIIVINGKRYDAHSGEIISPAGYKPHQDHEGVADSISPKQAKILEPYHPPLAPSAETPKKHSRANKSRPTAHHPHHPQSSQTLMRHTVKRPASSIKRHTKLTVPLDSSLIRPDVARIVAVDHHRLSRAHHVPKSKLIKRFDDSTRLALPAAADEPIAERAKPHTVSVRRPTAGASHHKPRTTADLLEHALHQATSHQQPAPKTKRRRSRRVTSLSAMALAVLTLITVVGYHNLTAFQLQVASSKAGLPVSLPSAKPSGYRLSHLKYGQGYVAMDFKSNSDDRAYTITEKASNWSTATLRDNFLTSKGHDYQLVLAGGRMVYLYDEQRSATWVSEGIWYQISSSGSLSQRQLVDLAGSM
jgi:hypothetical protein